jgi:hypothetical protein
MVYRKHTASRKIHVLMRFEIILAVFSQNTQRTPRGQNADILNVKVRTVQYSLYNVAAASTVSADRGTRGYISVMAALTCAYFFS